METRWKINLFFTSIIASLANVSPTCLVNIIFSDRITDSVNFNIDLEKAGAGAIEKQDFNPCIVE